MPPLGGSIFGTFSALARALRITPNLSQMSEEEGNDTHLSPDGEGDDYEAILGGDNSSAFRRYAVPPHYDGNSSDEGELHPETGLDDEVKDPEGSAEEYVEEVTEDQGYAPLVADEFGEFVSSEDFGDYYSPDNVVPLSVLAATGRVETKESETGLTPAPVAVRPENVRISIPPLDASKSLTWPFKPLRSAR